MSITAEIQELKEKLAMLEKAYMDDEIFEDDIEEDIFEDEDDDIIFEDD